MLGWLWQITYVKLTGASAPLKDMGSRLHQGEAYFTVQDNQEPATKKLRSAGRELALCTRFSLQIPSPVSDERSAVAVVNWYYTVTLILSRNVRCLDHD